MKEELKNRIDYLETKLSNYSDRYGYSIEGENREKMKNSLDFLEKLWQALYGF